jgi:hypothetical protein
LCAFHKDSKRIEECLFDPKVLEPTAHRLLHNNVEPTDIAWFCVAWMSEDFHAFKLLAVIFDLCLCDGCYNKKLKQKSTFICSGGQMEGVHVLQVQLTRDGKLVQKRRSQPLCNFDDFFIEILKTDSYCSDEKYFLSFSFCIYIKSVGGEL